MKTIIIYYSQEGNTKLAAQEIAVQLEAETLQVEPMAAYPTGSIGKYFWGGKDVLIGARPLLKPYKFQADDYDAIIIGTPIWAGSYTPPIRSFIAENDLKGKKIGLFACSGSGSAKKCFEKMKKEIDIQDNTPTMSLRNPAKRLSSSDQQRIDNFCKKFLLK